MPANTTKGFPYVLPTDNVADYPVTMQQLATLLEAMVPFRFATGTVNIVASGASNTGNAIVTFPAGLFTQPPIVVVSKTSTAQKAIPWTASTTTAQTTIGFWTGDATNVGASTLTFFWIAMQATPTVAFSDGIGPIPTDEDVAAVEAAGAEAGEDVSGIVAMFRQMQEAAA
jgi:hypothetical protein